MYEFDDTTTGEFLSLAIAASDLGAVKKILDAGFCPSIKDFGEAERVNLRVELDRASAASAALVDSSSQVSQLIGDAIRKFPVRGETGLPNFSISSNAGVEHPEA